MSATCTTRKNAAGPERCGEPAAYLVGGHCEECPQKVAAQPLCITHTARARSAQMKCHRCGALAVVDELVSA